MGHWQAGTEFLRTRSVNFPKKAVNVRGPTWEQFTWDLVGGFYLWLENLTITWRCPPVYSITWVLLLMIASVCKELASSTAKEGPHLKAGWLYLSASKCLLMTHFPQQNFHKAGIQGGLSGECLRGSSQATILLFAGESLLWEPDQLKRQTATDFSNVSLSSMNRLWKGTLKFVLVRLRAL